MCSIKFGSTLAVLVVLAAFFYTRYNSVIPQMNGTSSPQFRPVVQTYKNFILSGTELGSSLSVFSGADNVVNIRGGYTDLRFRLPWSPETVTQSFMISLLCVPLTFAVLIERSLVDITQPVGQFLPWFSVSNITISDLLTHRAGFPYFMDKISLASWRDDYRAILTNISRQVPPITPKSRMWHFHSLALLADGIVRVVDLKHRTLGHFFMEEIVWPLGIDVLVGIPRSQLYRVARTYHAGWFEVLTALLGFDHSYLWTNLRSNAWMPYGGIRERSLDFFTDFHLLYNRDPDLLEIPLASSHMFTDARNLASLLHALLIGPKSSGANASHLFSPTTLQWLLTPVDTPPAYDAVLQRPVAFTSSGLMVSTSPEGNPIYGMWDDIMGQVAFVDPKRQLTMAYVTNHAHGQSLDKDTLLHSLWSSVYSCLPTTTSE